MNERFLFRGRRYDNGEWITGWITSQFKKFTEGEVLTYIKSNVFGGGEHLVNTKTVGQCTGLKDKNGKLIFEGDIIEYMDAYSDCNGEYTEFMNGGEVAYEDGSYFITNRSSVEMSDIVYKGKFDGNIIGNIHDNPELLEVER